MRPSGEYWKDPPLFFGLQIFLGKKLETVEQVRAALIAMLEGRAQVILWEVEPDMAYTFGLYLYLFVASVVAGIGAARSSATPT
jgi:hypothetical protein